MNTTTRNGKSRYAVGAVIGLLLFVILFFTINQEAHAQERIIKVGYTSDETVAVNADGSYSGYIVDYLEEIAQYTGWEYEFIKGTWAEHMERMANGDLDLMGMIRYTEEREEDMLFSEFSIAEDYTALMALEDSEIYYADHETFQGMKVGLIKGTIHETAFLEHAQEQGFTCDVVYYRTEEETQKALAEGKIDMMAASGLASYDHLKVVGQFALERTYFVTGKQNEALMKELDEAIEEVRIQNPELMGELTEKYYSVGDMVTNLRLTRAEQEYIDTAETIVIKGFAGREPFAYEEDGAYKGIYPDYIEKISECTGLKFQLEFTEDMFLGAHASAMKAEDYGMVYIEYPNRNTAERYGLVATKPMFESGLSTIKLKEFAITEEGQALIIGLTREMDYLEKDIHSVNPQHTIKYYDTTGKCIKAVMTGEVDVSVQNEYNAEYFMQKAEYMDHLLVTDTEATEGLCLYFPEDQQMLAQIINKAIDYLAGDMHADTMSEFMMNHSYQYGIQDFRYQYGSWAMFIALLIALMTSMIMLIIRRARQYRQQEREKAELEAKLQKDELTGVYSRPYFFKKAEEMLRECDEEIYIIRMNVSRFKVFNELYGSEKGDRLLKVIGEILKEEVIDKGFAAGRFSGDHFYCCITKSEFDNVQFYKKVELDWIDMEVRFTYGVYPVGDGRDIPVSVMCDRADMANKESAKGAGHIRYYTDEERQRLIQEQQIESEMEQAIAERQFCIFIQPKYRVTTGKIVGGEALVRWRHPERGMIPPGQFIGVFERNGFIKKLDYYVWEEACRFLADAKQSGRPFYPLSVNVSRIHFYEEELEDKLEELLGKYGLNREDLELEITESIYAEDSAAIIKRCKKLKDAGFKIAMDDFGSGYSSLNMLKEMPLDIIKMDLRFLSGGKDTEQIRKGNSILQTLIEMSYALDLNVVVEGVETEEQRDFIREIGHCAAQGYYYSKPVETAEYEAMLRQESDDV